MEQYNIFGGIDKVEVKKKSSLPSLAKGNPKIKLVGKGPEGEKCKTCEHLYRKVYAKTYLKCAMGKDSNGPATDIRANWDACALWVAIKEGK